MSFLIYFAVLLFAAASALFGLDVLTAPLPKQHHPRPPIEQSASVQKNQQAEPTNKLGREMAAREDAEKAKADTAKNEGALTPVYPTAPGAAKSEVREVYPPSNPALSAVVAKQNQDKQAANAQQPQPQQPAQSQPQQPQQTASTQPARNETTGSAQRETAQQASGPDNTAAQEAKVQPAAQQTSNKCNIQACSAAYQSFSAADCTYQPFEGPRRLCTRGGDKQRVASQPAQDEQRSEQRQYSRQYSTDVQRQERRQDHAQGADRDAGLRDAVRRVKSMRNWAADDDYADAPVVVGRGGGRRYIVVPAGDDDW